MKPSCLFILLLGVAVVFADSSSDSKSGGSSGSSEKGSETGGDEGEEIIEEGNGPPVVISTEHVVGEESLVLQSPNYPEDAPANLRRTWKLSSAEGTKIKVECEDIRLFEENPCGPWKLVITDGEGESEVCTSIFDWSTTSSGNSLTMHMETGGADRGFLSCKAVAV